MLIHLKTLQGNLIIPNVVVFDFFENTVKIVYEYSEKLYTLEYPIDTVISYHVTRQVDYTGKY
jgi:hypothetical protein